MDFIKRLRKSKGKDVILVVVGCFTKYRHFFALAHRFTVVTVPKAFLYIVSKLYGASFTIISNCGSIFLSQFWTKLFQWYKAALYISASSIDRWPNWACQPMHWKYITVHVFFQAIQTGSMVTIGWVVVKLLIPLIFVSLTISCLIRVYTPSTSDLLVPLYVFA